MTSASRDRSAPFAPGRRKAETSSDIGRVPELAEGQSFMESAGAPDVS
jgi:hypothetical protein